MELQKKEYIVDYASTGKEALSLAHETDFDLVLMSFQLSDMSSKELAKELLAIKPATVIIVVVETTEVAEHGEDILTYAVFYVFRSHLLLVTWWNKFPIFSVVEILLKQIVNRFICMRPIEI
jgi:CheY-like chemotaxis protein